MKHPERVDDLVLDFDVANMRRNVESMVSLIACIADWRRLGYRRELILGERWRALTMPTLLLWPEHDAFGSQEKGEALVATNPELRLVRITGAGHNAWIDDPETVVAEIERFREEAAKRRESGDLAPPERVADSAALTVSERGAEVRGRAFGLTSVTRPTLRGKRSSGRRMCSTPAPGLTGAGRRRTTEGIAPRDSFCRHAGAEVGYSVMGAAEAPSGRAKETGRRPPA